MRAHQLYGLQSKPDPSLTNRHARNTLMNHPRVLLITRNLPPLVGGMERLNWHMADELAKQAEVQVIGPRGAAALAPKSVTLTEAPLKPLPLFLLISFLKGLWIITRKKPDIILAGSGLTAPIAWLLSKLCGARSAAYLHGFDITVDNGIYRKLWRPTFRKLDRVIVNSTPTQELALAAGVSQHKITTVHPGVSLPDKPQPEDRILAFREQHGLIGKKILLSVGRLTSRKGLREFVERSLPSIIQAEPEAMLVVIGEAPQNSLGASIQTEESIKAQAEDSGVPHYIKFLGSVSNESLSVAYEAADVHVFPIRHIANNPEGFGMVAIEAAAHGLPTVAFATGGVIDAVGNGTSGHLIESENYNEFSQQVVNLLQQSIPAKTIQNFSQTFSWCNFGGNIWDSLAVHQVQQFERQAHVVKDLPSRALKAKKIESLLDLDKVDREKNLRILEVGCGSGGISQYFATQSGLNCDVTGIDIQDNRQVIKGYRFVKVDSVKIPFPDASFDIVITNHVIEHVGESNDQIEHLREVRRVLSPLGQCYLAVPNRWMVTEPHYNLKFLSWLPHNMRTRYLRWSGKGEYYDCEPLAPAQLEGFLRMANMSFENVSIPATRLTFELEKPNSFATKLLRKLPDSFLKPFTPIIPTLIYRLEPKT